LPSSAPEKTWPIQPGIFKGTTRYDGIQLLLLSYKNNVNKVTGQKITVYIYAAKLLNVKNNWNYDDDAYDGDAIVSNLREIRIFPLDKFLSKLIFATACTYLNQEMQTDMDRINQIEAESSDLNDLPQPQPFLIPQNCEKQFPELPNDCLAR